MRHRGARCVAGARNRDPWSVHAGRAASSSRWNSRRPIRPIRRPCWRRAAALQGPGRRDQYHRRRRRQLPHVERCGRGSAGCRRPHAGMPDRLPRPQPDRHAGRYARAPPRWVCSNVLCLTGDDVRQGDHPEAKPVFDLDSVSLLDMAPRDARSRASYASGRRLESRAAACFWARQPIRCAAVSKNEWPTGKEDCRRRPDSSRPSTASTSRCSRPSCARCARRDLDRRAHIIVGVGRWLGAAPRRWLARARSGGACARTPCSRASRRGGSEGRGKACASASRSILRAAPYRGRRRRSSDGPPQRGRAGGDHRRVGRCAASIGDVRNAV